MIQNKNIHKKFWSFIGKRDIFYQTTPLQSMKIHIMRALYFSLIYYILRYCLLYLFLSFLLQRYFMDIVL